MYVQVLALILRDCACIPIYLSSYIGADPPGLCFHMFTRIGADPPGLCRDIFVRIGADSPRLYLHMHTQKHSNTCIYIYIWALLIEHCSKFI